jgi:phosphatidylinositol alpha-1,6-mannosyltransferase
VSGFLFIASNYKPNLGGIATYIDNLARGLIKVGIKANVLALVHPDDRQRMAFLKNYEEWVEPFPVVYSNWKIAGGATDIDERPKSFVASRLVSSLEIVRCIWPLARSYLDQSPCFRRSSEAMMRLSSILGREKPAAFIFGHLDINFYPFVFPLLERQVPYGIIAHDFEIHKTRSRVKVNDVVRRGMLLKKARWISANSRNTKSLLEAWGLPSEKIVITHPPIAEEAIRKSTQLGLTPSSAQIVTHNETSFTLVTVCRLVRGKGVDIVLHALKLLTQKNIPFRYIVAGDGPERGNLEQLARECGVSQKTFFAGCVTEEEKWSLLQSADVFVMPSRVKTSEQHEGFGLAFVEAGAFGVPAVGTRAGGIPDAVLDGETGILVDPESPSRLAEVLTFLYNDPGKRREMGEKGKKRAQTQLSPTAVATRFLEEVYRRI